MEYETLCQQDEAAIRLFLQRQSELLKEMREALIGSLPLDIFIAQQYGAFKAEKPLERLIADERAYICRIWAAVSVLRTAEFKSSESQDKIRRRNLVRKIDHLVSRLHDADFLRGLESSEFGDLFICCEGVGIDLAFKALELERELLKAKAAVHRAPQVGRPMEATQDFARRLTIRWFQLTGLPPSVSHVIDEPIRSGPFVDFLQAAIDTLQQPELDGNVGVAAERAAFWFREEH